MLNEWSDRDPGPPSPRRDRLVIGLSLLTGVILVINVIQRLS